jgi:replication-associated recombination protein RarA
MVIVSDRSIGNTPASPEYLTMQTLAEKYRPATLEEVIGQDKAVSVIRRLQDRGTLAGRAYWLAAKSGVGKTTLARIMAESVADPLNIVELDASALTPAMLRDIERDSSMYGIGAKSGRAFIVNEAHGLRRDTIRQLLVLLERIPDHVLWAFTTTQDGQEALFEDCADASPLLSRCLALPVTSQPGAAKLGERVYAIAEAEGLGGKTLAQVQRFVSDCAGNMRAALNQLEAGALLA